MFHLPALWGETIWDDSLVTQNPRVRAPGGIFAIWSGLEGTPGKDPRYWPLLYTSFWLEHRLWGGGMFGSHLINVLLHSLNAVLLWRVLRRLKISAAFFGALLWAVHPLGAESVAWILERKGLLSTTFFLGAALSFFHQRNLSRSGLPVLSLFLFSCALLTKPVVLMFPVVLGIAMWWQGGTLARRNLRALAPFLGLALFYGLFTAWLSHRTEPASFGYSWWERIAVACRAGWFYAGKTFWPHPLMAIYPRWDLAAASVGWALHPLTLGAALGVLWWNRRRWGRGPFAAALAFLVLLLPTLGFLDFSYMAHSFVADRYGYLARVPLLVLVAGGLAGIAGGWRREFRAGIAILLILALGIPTLIHVARHKNAETLFGHTLSRNPGAWGAHNALGFERMRQGRIEESIEHFRAALALNPTHPRAMINLGAALEELGHVEQSETWYRKSISVSPDYGEGYYHLARLLIGRNRSAEALTPLQEAIRLDPGNAAYAFEHAACLAKSGEVERAIGEYKRAIALDSSLDGARINLGDLYQQQGKPERAEPCYSAVLARNPSHPEANLNRGNLAFRDGRFAEAERHYRIALEANPDLPEARNNLGAALAAQQRYDEAVREFAALLEMEPERPDVEVNLARALLELDRPAEAARHFQNAARIYSRRGDSESARRVEERLHSLLPAPAPAPAPAAHDRTTSPGAALRPLEIMNRGTEKACLAYNGKALFAFGPMNEEAVFFARLGSDLYNVREWARWQRENGMNYVRCYPQSGYGWTRDVVGHPDYLMPFDTVAEAPLRFDLDRFNPEYWKNFAAVLATLRSHDIIVHLQLFQQCYFEMDGGNRWPFNFWNPVNNTNGFTQTLAPVGRGRHPFWEQIGEGNPQLRAHYLEYLDHILDAVGDKGNVIIDLCNELGDGGLDGERAKQWIELTLDHIEAWRQRTGNTVIVGQDYTQFPDREYLMRHPRMDVIIAHGNHPWNDWTEYEKPVVLVNLHLRRFILSYGQTPERFPLFRKAHWRALLSRAQGVGDYQKEWRTARPGAYPQFDREARLLRAFVDSLEDYPNLLPRNNLMESAPGENCYCLASDREVVVYMESGRFEQNVRFEAQTVTFKELPLRGRQVEVTLYAPDRGVLSKTRHSLSGGQLELHLPTFTDDMAIRLLARDTDE